MKSQIKWGISFIVLGILLTFVVFPITLIYSVPLMVIGVALIIFYRREDIIESVEIEKEFGR